MLMSEGGTVLITFSIIIVLTLLLWFVLSITIENEKPPRKNPQWEKTGRTKCEPIRDWGGHRDQRWYKEYKHVETNETRWERR